MSERKKYFKLKVKMIKQGHIVAGPRDLARKGDYKAAVEWLEEQLSREVRQ